MIGLGLRLALSGGRAAIARLGVIAAAVACGVGMLLVTLAAVNAVNAQNARYAWLETGQTPASHAPAPGGADGDPLWWGLSADTFDGTEIGRVDVAATGANSPVPPGIPRLPGAGEYYASPTLATLLETTPRDELADRYPGRLVGEIGDDALPAPNSLLIVIGHTPAELADSGIAMSVRSIATSAPSDCQGCAIGVGINANGIILVLGVVALAILLPVLVFIGTATRLSAAQREQRFAAMRLVGATPRQISVISAVESSGAAIVGAALGFAVFFAVRDPVAGVPFTGAPFFAADLSLNLADVLTVVIGVPVAAAVAARVALRRVNISPLGVTRRVMPRPPRAWRVLPLVAGIGELTWFFVAGAPATTNGQLWAYFSGFLLIIMGLLLAGPWLTMAGSRLLARRARRPAALIAGRRLADDPRGGFRAISGLVLALFVTSVAVGVITTMVAYTHGSGGGATQAGTLLKTFFTHPSDTVVENQIDALPTGLDDDLAAIPGVRGVAVIHANPAAREGGPGGPDAGPDSLVSCAQLDHTPAIGRCETGASVVGISSFFGNTFGKAPTASEQIWPGSDVTPVTLKALPVRSIVVATDGSTAAIEAVRTTLELAAPDRFAPDTLAALSPSNNRLLTGYRQLANVVILVSLPIAGCSLAVSVIAGLADRRRPFSLLRLTGMPLRTLRRVIALEAAAPLLITAFVSLGVGFLAAHLFLRTQLDESLQPPGVQYYVIVAAGLLASLGVIASTMPLLRRITGPEASRNE